MFTNSQLNSKRLVMLILYNYKKLIAHIAKSIIASLSQSHTHSMPSFRSFSWIVNWYRTLHSLFHRISKQWGDLLFGPINWCICVMCVPLYLYGTLCHLFLFRQSFLNYVIDCLQPFVKFQQNSFFFFFFFWFYSISPFHGIAKMKNETPKYESTISESKFK